MPQLPLVVWLAVAGFALLLLCLCALTVHAMLRASTRAQMARWPGPWILALVAAAAIPWLVVWFAPITITVNVHGILQLIGWSLLAIGAFALLVLVPLAAALSAAIWSLDRRS